MELHGVLFKRVLAFEALLAQRTFDRLPLFSGFSILLHLLLVLAICKRGLLLEKCDKLEEDEEARPIVPCPVCALLPAPLAAAARTEAQATGTRSSRQSQVGRQS